VTGRITFAILAAVVLLSRFSQLDILWVEEAYPTAAAMEILRGKFLYRDIWFDKPPLYALTYLLWDAQVGFALRWAGVLFVGLGAALTYRFAFELWGRVEGVIAGSLLTLYLTFGVPSAVMALAPDLLTIVPHVAAIYLAWKRKPGVSGFAAAVAFLTNAKAVLILIPLLVWVWPAWRAALAGFVVPNVFLIAVLLANDALRDYWEQVWAWGAIYAADPFAANPLLEGLQRTANWAGFHACAVAGTVWFAWRERDRRWLVWLAVAALMVLPGWRFFPRYYFMVLPVVCLMAARGIARMPRMCATAVLALALIPVVRFGPRYVKLLTGDHTWTDLAMNNDSKAAAEIVKSASKPDDTLLVWGYRPDIFVYSGLRAGTRYLDSQPLTGVIADRHLTQSRPSTTEIPARNRARLPKVPATFVVDGLGRYNPELAIDRFIDISAYRVIGRTAGTVIYQH
jgi:hypothetical protein